MGDEGENAGRSEVSKVKVRQKPAIQRPRKARKPIAASFLKMGGIRVISLEGKGQQATEFTILGKVEVGNSEKFPPWRGPHALVL
jgi:hypothetical protein